MSFVTEFFRKHETLRQSLSYVLLSLIATAVDFLVFNLLNGWLLVPLAEKPFSWWIVSYPVSAGGLCAFLATVFAYFFAQLANFFVQRRFTFNASGHAVKSMILYLIMITATWFFQIVMGGVFMSWFTPLFGAFWAGNLARCADNFLTMVIQFPINKFVIMKKEKQS